jgi:hypothetical protein
MGHSMPFQQAMTPTISGSEIISVVRNRRLAFLQHYFCWEIILFCSLEVKLIDFTQISHFNLSDSYHIQ